MQLAIFGLGRMGMQIAQRLHKNNFDVIAWNRSPEPRAEFLSFALQQSSGSSRGKAAETVEQAAAQLSETPRVFWVMLPSAVVQDFLFGEQGLVEFLKPGDIVIDGGNSFYKDSIRRAEKLEARGVHFFDAGTSGGVWGEANGFAIMVGGPSRAWQTVEPIFKALSSGENYGLVGRNGAGHFVKMVHNGIEYGMMEAIAEGYGVLNASDFNLDLAQVSKIYQKGSVVSSWLIDLTRTVFEKEDIDATSGIIHATGEGEWTINAAKELGVDARVIEDAFKVRQESNLPENQAKFSNKIVALLRKQFGGHAVEKK